MSGLIVLAGVVLAGLGSGAAYYHYKQPKLAAELDAQIAAAPKSPEGRLEQWHVFGAPQIHHRLSKFARFSEALPWIITHSVGIEGQEVDVWGVDCAALPKKLSHLEGLTVVIDLPAPVSLGRVRLEGEMARHVPHVAPGTEPPDAARRLRELAVYFLENVPKALAKDIPGATVEIRVGS